MEPEDHALAVAFGAAIIVLVGLILVIALASVLEIWR